MNENVNQNEEIETQTDSVESAEIEQPVEADTQEPATDEVNAAVTAEDANDEAESAATDEEPNDEEALPDTQGDLGNDESAPKAAASEVEAEAPKAKATTTRQRRTSRTRKEAAEPQSAEDQLVAALKKAQPVTGPDAPSASSARMAAAEREYGGNRAMMRDDARTREAERQQRQNERDANLMAWSSLMNARQRHQIIYVMIATARILPNSYTAVASGMIEGFRVTIPYAAMFINPDTLEDDDEMRRARRQQRLLQKMIGCTVPVIITDMVRTPDGDYGIAASRTLALQRLRQLNFEGKPPRIKEGDSVMADVIAVGNHSVRVNVAGFDGSIQINRLTVRYMENAQEHYYPGQKIRVIISRVNYDENGKVTGVVPNAIAAEMEDLKPNLRQVALHETCFATITHIPRPRPDQPGVAHPWLYLDHLDLPARAMRVRTDALTTPLKSGDKVMFFVTRLDEERGVVIGDIMQRISTGPEAR